MKKLIEFLKSLFGKKPKTETPAPVVVAPTPAPVPAAPPPVVYTTPAPVALGGWPVGAYEFIPGAWYVPDKKRGATAGPFKMPAEYDAWCVAVDARDAGLAQWQRDFNAQVHAGLFPAVNFIFEAHQGAEAAFIYAASRIYRATKDGKSEWNADMYRDCGLFSGTNNDISSLINYGEQEQIFLHKSYAQTIADFPDTPVKQAVMAVLNAA